MIKKENNLDAAACYAAFKAHDARFDGRIFMGVSSTGIYCRPVCRVKTPKEKNCSFHASAAAAEAEGFRPCLKCRPELAPGNSLMDASSILARKAALAIEAENFPTGGLAELAASLGVSDRHLRRAFAAEYGVSPVQYLQTRRLLLAKNLLTDTRLSITEAAMAAGFGSIRRFNDLFRKQYRLSPGGLRKQGAQAPKQEEEGITLLLGYRPPYAWDELLSFFSGRAIPGVENVSNGSYCRTVAVQNGGETLRGWFRVRNLPEKSALAVTLGTALLPVLPRLLARIRVLFDVNCEPFEIYERISSLNERLPGMVAPGLRLPGCFDPFEMAVRAVLGQQITVKAAGTLAKRFALTFGESVATPFADLTHTFPGYMDVVRLGRPVEDRFGPLGIIGARARSILALAEALAEGRLTLAQHADPDAVRETLCSLPGFGPWTAEYIAMRALGWPDAFPHTDYGVKKALAGLAPGEILAMAEKWRPWRSYATIGLWSGLGKMEAEPKSTLEVEAKKSLKVKSKKNMEAKTKKGARHGG